MLGEMIAQVMVTVSEKIWDARSMNVRVLSSSFLLNVKSEVEQSPLSTEVKPTTGKTQMS